MDNRRDENIPKTQYAQDMIVKILATVYVGGAYGLVIITVIQICIVLSWFN